LKGEINIDVAKLTIDKVNSGTADPWENDAFVSGKRAGIPVTVSVFRQEWDKIEDGEYYDFINKVVVKKYRYNERKVLVAEKQVVTDRNGQASFSFDAEDKKSYFVQLTAQDARNNQAKSEIYLSGGNYPQYYGYSWYYLEDNNNSDGKYAEGEEVLLTVKNNENEVPERAGGFLFYTAQRGIMDYQVQDTGSYKTIFTGKDIPNLWVKGVYFDGRSYHETTDYLAAYDEKEKGLVINISTDKEVYRPKDKVQVNLEVLDKEGRPVAATVNLNLVDEALFMLSPQEVDTLRSLYGDYLSSGILMTATTHDNPANYFGGGAEQGGEGGSGRQDFKDTAFFKTITTGKDGKASVSFTVPDNLTAWRLTYQAVTEDLQGASGTTKVKVRLPFFVDMVLNDRYLAGDKPMINLRSLGTDLDEGREVAYHVEVTRSEKEVFDEKLTGKAFLFTPVSLPALEEGDYQITVTAIGAGQQDTLTLPFQVAESYMTQEKTDYALLTAQSKIEADTKKPVTLIFADANWSQYLSNLLSLAYVEGNRVEQKLAPQIALELLKENYDQFAYLPLVSDQDLSSYQTEDGGIAILPYGSSDLEVSAKIAPWAKDHFDLDALASYFEKIVNDSNETRERGIIALYGLASLGEPVLQEVELAAKESDLTLSEQLYLILAFSELGNEQPAGKMLKQLLKTYGEANGPYMQINSGNDKDDLVKITVLAALAAERLMLDEGNMLHRYVMENPPQKELIYLEQIAFLQNSLRKLTPEETGFTYIIEGKKQDVKLKPGETYSLVLTPEKLKLLSFENIKGEVGVTSLYQGAFAPSGESFFEGVSITRDYQVAGKSTRQFQTGDLVEVKVSWNIGGKAPNGTYRITDYLPSGLKLVEKPYSFDVAKNNLGWPVEVDGQKGVFLVSEKGSFSYYARIINQGSFTGENMTLQHVENGKMYGMTSLDKVDIK
ncbi:MAG: alpha-2-macroglobulin family protein, partial [Dehalobacterium sp.]